LELGNIGGKPVDALAHGSETARYRGELIGRSPCGWGGRDRRSGRGLWGQPLKLWGQARDHSPGRIAVGLPGQGGSDTDAARNQVAGEREQGSLDARRSGTLYQVKLAGVKRRVVQCLGRPPAFGDLGQHRPQHRNHRHLPLLPAELLQQATPV
jgi:hypothetical protein